MELNAKQQQNLEGDFVLDEELVLLANEGDTTAQEIIINTVSYTHLDVYKRQT